MLLPACNRRRTLNWKQLEKYLKPIEVSPANCAAWPTLSARPGVVVTADLIEWILRNPSDRWQWITWEHEGIGFSSMIERLHRGYRGQLDCAIIRDFWSTEDSEVAAPALIDLIKYLRSQSDIVSIGCSWPDVSRAAKALRHRQFDVARRWIIDDIGDSDHDTWSGLDSL